MSDRKISSASSRMLSDRHIDELLTAFFDHEVPATLADPPFSRDVITATRPTLVTAASRGVPTQSSLRSITAVAAMLAACLIVVLAGSQLSVGPEAASTIVDKQRDAASDDLMDVSTNPGADIPVDDNNTSLREIDQIDLSPGDADRRNDD